MGWGRMDKVGIMEGGKAFQVIVFLAKNTSEDLHCPMLLYKGVPTLPVTVPRLEHQNQWQ